MPTCSILTSQGVPSNLPATALAQLLPSSRAPSEQQIADQDDDRSTEGSKEYVCYRIDFQPFLPPALASSIITEANCTLVVQIPMLGRLTSLPQGPFIGLVISLNGLSLVLTGHCKFAHPGHTKKTRSVTWLDLEEGQNPRRAHRSWQFARPIRQYDHWCKWLNNVIGLLNQRFSNPITLLSRLHQCSSSCSSVSASSACWESPSTMWLTFRRESVLFHQGLFEYVSERNMQDKGCPTSCVNFWCWPHWSSAEKGEF